MAVYITTSNPNKLLEQLKQAIAAGKIQTWIQEPVGFFTHEPTQWRRKAWFKPGITSTGLIFNIIKPQNGKLSSIDYAVYHGRLIECFLSHFDSEFSDASASAYPRVGDVL